MGYKQPSYEERITFYLGNIINGNINYNLLKENLNKLNADNTIYDEKLKILLLKTNNISNFSFYCGDNEHDKNIETLMKNRCCDNMGVILRCLNFSRHWTSYYNKPKDIPFDKKLNCVFWRGTTTGQQHRLGNRFNMIKKWFNKEENIDVGFSNICQGKNEYENYVKGKCGIHDFLKHKYILSIEGNDKDSGINWKLNSNSVVLMPKPRVTSWLMETTLIPDYHYVLIKDDFSDLKEKVEWCDKNQDKCKEIIKNSNNFMDQFKDNEIEEKLETDVINKYFELIKQ
jgi:hypothetical protein